MRDALEVVEGGVAEGEDATVGRPASHDVGYYTSDGTELIPTIGEFRCVPP